jgi:lipoyl(octanoyl) transferase
MSSRLVEIKSLGKMPFNEAWQLQREIFDLVRHERVPDTILTVEHPHTYTLGKSSHRDHLLWPPSELLKKGIEVYEIDRGGDITYHGPGQFVAYPILNMNHFYHDVHRYLRDLEEVVIRLLGDYGIDATRKQHPDPRKNYTGVWVGERKICAIGVRFSHWTTMHGLALNVSTDLAYYHGIVPCGIRDKELTSIKNLLKKECSISDVEANFIAHFEAVFGVKISYDKSPVKGAISMQSKITHINGVDRLPNFS